MKIDLVDEVTGAGRSAAMSVELANSTIDARTLIRTRVELEHEAMIERLGIEQAFREAKQTEQVAEQARLAERLSRAQADMHRWLVQPGDAETLLNGERGKFGPGIREFHQQSRRERPAPPPPPPLAEVEALVAVALAGFEAGKFFLLIDDRQVVSLDEVLKLHETAEVVFLKLVPLQGG